MIGGMGSYLQAELLLTRMLDAWRYNSSRMQLSMLHTLSHSKPFEYKYVDGGEIIVYPSDDDRQPQREYALVITRFEQELVRNAIKEAGRIVVGASRDNPPDRSLGALLRARGRVPQILSYLSAILAKEGFCTPSRNRNTLELVHNTATSGFSRPVRNQPARP
jgi:hypothetical protein